MNRIGKFEKVSYDQFRTAIFDHYGDHYPELDIRAKYERIKLPRRGTSKSAGYDIFSTLDEFELDTGETIKVPTGIRVKIDDGWFLMCAPRSGSGFKYRVRLANTIGVVDGDYYESDNEGHIFLKLTRDSRSRGVFKVCEGDGISQAIFLPYGITYNDNADGIRNGGFGSTGA